MENGTNEENSKGTRLKGLKNKVSKIKNKYNNSKIRKIINLKTISILLLIVILICIYSLITRGKLKADIKTLSLYSNSANVDFQTKIYNSSGRYNYYYDDYYYNSYTKREKSLLEKLAGDKVTINAYLEDENGKKVNGTTQKVKTEIGENSNFSLELPDNLEKGNYTIKLSVKNGILKDKFVNKITLTDDAKDSILISCDKGIYKPGDTIKYRALITDNSNYKPEQKDLTVSIYDGNGNRVYYEEAKTSEYGIVSGQFVLGDSVNSGTYKLTVNMDNFEKTKFITVDSYTEERFSINYENVQDFYRPEQQIKFDIKLNYFFGESVKNAKVVVTNLNTNSVMNFESNDEGIVNFVDTDLNTKKVGSEVNFKIEVTDSSNYYVSKTKSVIISDEKYIIELIPEYQQLVAGNNNRMFLYVKKVDGTPISSYNRITFNGINREVTTDDFGAVSFMLSSEDVNSLTNELTINVATSIMDNDVEEVIRKNFTFSVNKTPNIVMTDKLIYNQGEQVKVNLGNFNESAQLYIVNGNKLVNSVSTDSSSYTIETNEMFGLIDIYSINNNNNNNTNKRTIFIKPTEDYKISLSTDKQEYLPSGDLKLSISNDKNEASAYLVSIIDKANLNMKDNDLNIDKIRLALENIKLSEDVNAAELYSAIMAENNEMEFQKILAKQSQSSLTMNSKYTFSEFDDERVAGILSVCGIALAICVLILLARNSKKIGKNSILEFIVIKLPVILVVGIIWGAAGASIFSTDNILMFILTIILSGVILITCFDEQIIYLFIFMLVNLLGVFLFGFVYDQLYNIDLEDTFVFIILIILILLFALRKKLGDRLKNVLKVIGQVILFDFILMLFFVITNFLFDDILDSYKYEEYSAILAPILTFAAYIIMKEKSFFNKGNNTGSDITGGTGKIEITGGALLFLLVIGIVGISGVLSIISNFSTNISGDDIYTAGDSLPSTRSSGGGGFTYNASLDVADSFNSKTDTSGASSSVSDVFDIFNVAGQGKSIERNKNTREDVAMVDVMTDDEMVYQEANAVTPEISSEEITHVRNVFLESLAFLPEVVAENGNKDVDIKLSDNITTWKVQVVGNTKEGNIGYSTSEFRVFKEFFTDFTVPNNLKQGDRIKIPVTIYNYTEAGSNADIKVVANEGMNVLSNSEQTILVPSHDSNLVYIELELKDVGTFTLRIEASMNGKTDIIERNVKVDYKGIKVNEISANGTTKQDTAGQVVFKDKFIEGSNKVKVKLYPNLLSIAVDDMDSILRLPTGCFEQISSSLYPDILVLQYLKENNIKDDEMKEKALEYINKGFQKILTYEVPGEPGGFSLYGHPNAEPQLTAYGLMEFNDLSKVYTIDDKLLPKMEKYLASVQQSNGNFERRRGSYIYYEYYDLQTTAYIAWAVSEYNPDSDVAKKAVGYLKENLDRLDDTYILGLTANAMINIKDKAYKDILNDLIKKVGFEENGTVVYDSKVGRDYLGCSGRYYQVKNLSLLSMALSKTNKENKMNQQLIDYIISQRSYSAWGTTESTIFALKAINVYNSNNKVEEGTVDIRVGNQTKQIEIKKDGIDYFELEFDNVPNNVEYEIKNIKSTVYYEVSKEFYKEYSDFEDTYKFTINRQFSSNNLNVNDLLTEKVDIQNISPADVDNVMVQVEIPQGFLLDKAKLDEYVAKGVIEKYENNYSTVDIYLRDMIKFGKASFEVQYRAAYPVNILGGSIKVYDYYNPDVVEYAKPENIIVND